MPKLKVELWVILTSTKMNENGLFRPLQNSFHTVIIIVKIHTHTIHTNALIAQPNLQFASIQCDCRTSSTALLQCTQTYMQTIFVFVMLPAIGRYIISISLARLVTIYLAVTTLRTTHTWTLTTLKTRYTQCHREIARHISLLSWFMFPSEMAKHPTNTASWQKKSHRVFHPL